MEAITKIEIPKKRKSIKILLGGDTILIKVHRKSVGANRHTQKTTKKAEQVGMDRRTYAFNNLKKQNTQLPYLAHYNPKSENILTTDASTKGLGATLWQKQKDGNLKPIGFASRFLSDTEKKYAINELELLAVVWRLEYFRLYIYGKPIELLTDHQALEPLNKRNRSNKTYSARLTRWLDRLAHFDIQIKHVAGKLLKLTNYLSRNPISKPEPIESYDEEYVINCIIPLLEFINNYGSITDERETTTRTNQRNSHKTNNQSNSRYVLKLQTSNNQQKNRSSFLPQQNSV